MGPEVQIVPARPEHIPVLVDAIRPAARDQIAAVEGIGPAEVLARNLAASDRAWAGWIGGDIAAMWGVVPLTLLSDTAAPWLIGGHGIDRHPIAFLRQSRAVINEMQRGYELLRGFVRVGHARALAWARWLGFEAGALIEVGARRVLFHPIERRA